VAAEQVQALTGQLQIAELFTLKVEHQQITIPPHGTLNSCHSEAERGGGIFFFATAACSGSIRRICGGSTTKHNTPLMLPVM
jgi:hypothetical protein